MEDVSRLVKAKSTHSSPACETSADAMIFMMLHSPQRFGMPEYFELFQFIFRGGVKCFS